MKESRPSEKTPKVVMVSGGFDPVHVGHIRLFEEAKKLGDKLIVVLNNDHWFRLKGKHEVFMPEIERKEILEALSVVDEVVVTCHSDGTQDISVCEEIKKIRPHVFANGGDRFADNIPEFKLCNDLGIEMVFNIGKGGKVQSSSELLKSYAEKHKKKIKK
ncbi:MAG TPA: adenylyltransferase/cytidyltransferase family protein [Candidatus Paceibacterota bacterium]|nr:adenylyltransferase/cytidyltransferase family protein [Candidatus Paceibacterota bacterium]